MSLFTKLKEIADWFQPTYKKIDEWDLPWLRDLCKALWNVLDDEVKKSLYTLITAMAKKYGEDVAKKIMEEWKKKFDEIVGTP